MARHEITNTEILSAIAQHGGITAAYLALGIPKSTFYALAGKAKAEEVLKAKAVEMLVPPLATARVNVRIKSLKGPAQVEPSLELLRGVHARREERAIRRDEFEVGPLGSSGPYMGAVFGVSGSRSPSVGAPVSRQHIRVLAIGDSHFHPGLPQTLRCMALIGHHAAATRPEHVVHIGDGSDWNSVCRHTKNDTWKARVKPSIRQDLDNFAENWEALNGPMDAAGVTSSRHYCMGNHDAWLETFEDSTPEIKGMATGERDAVLDRAGWTHSSYGEFFFVGGVAFVHVPLNIMGKPAGGQTPEVTISNQVTHDVVFGHTHRENRVVRPKMGYSNKVTIVNTGSSMPEFYVGDYAQNTQGSALSHGIVDIDIFDGRIQSSTFVPMRELERRYGHLVGEV